MSTDILINIPQQTPQPIQVQVPVQQQVPVQKSTPVNKVNFKAVNGSNIAMASFGDKKIEKAGSAPITYMEAPIRYNYGNTVDDFLVEGPILTSNGGIWESKDAGGKTSHSIMSKLGNEGEEPQLRQCLDIIHASLAQQMIPHKIKLGLGDFPDNMIPNMLKKPHQPPKDKATKQPKAGEAPLIYWKLFRQGFGVMEEKTTFTGLDKKNYSWDMLKGVLLKYQPLFHVSCVYSGQGKSITIKLKSAIVIDVKNKATMQYQNDTIDQYNAQNPDDVKILQERMAQLILERKEATETQIASGNQYPDGLAPANVAKDPLANKAPIQVPTQTAQPQQYGQPQIVPHQVQPQQQYGQTGQYQQQVQPQIPQNFQAPIQTGTPQFQNFQQNSPTQQSPQQPPTNTLGQMQAFMQQQPTVTPTLNLAPVPIIPGLNTANPQFATANTPGLTIQ